MYLYDFNMKLRHHIVIFLLTLMAFQTVSHWLLPLYQLVSLRTAFSRLTENEIKNSKTSNFCISKENFQQNKFGKHEIWYQGLLFDIISIQVKNDSIWINAVIDQHEQNILNGFRQIFQIDHRIKSQKNQPFLKFIAQFLAQPFLVPLNDFTLQNWEFSRVKSSFCYQIYFLSTLKKVLLPPPKSCFKSKIILLF
jgi:hypothetical protein